MARGSTRLWAGLLALGACVLLFRTVRMLVQGALGVLMPWVSLLLLLELVLDVVALVAALRWMVTRAYSDSHLPLRVGAAAAVLHAARVLIFVLGRTGPWVNFDVQPAQRALHDERWSWFWVWFAAALSIAGVVGVVVIALYRHRHRPSVVTP